MFRSACVVRPSNRYTRRTALGVAALLTAALATACADGEPGPATAAREVPLTVIERDGQTMVLAPVSIGGAGPFMFVLDTGASVSAVDDDLARQLDLPRTGERQPISGVVGQDTVPVVAIGGWELGDVRLDPADATVVDLDALRGGRPLQGLLGSDVLGDFGRITVDYEEEVLLLTPR
ncbi:aspartyl protease family protein [Streptomyces bullii]|uniref:Aspartyl protease family protein n=1 Tax=Streptomyces bullii TaxID=349910 RepID=A0ABW0UYZ3_9ACTN